MCLAKVCGATITTISSSSSGCNMEGVGGGSGESANKIGFNVRPINSTCLILFKFNLDSVNVALDISGIHVIGRGVRPPRAMPRYCLHVDTISEKSHWIDVK